MVQISPSNALRCPAAEMELQFLCQTRPNLSVSAKFTRARRWPAPVPTKLTAGKTLRSVSVEWMSFPVPFYCRL